jgi:FixJ family two-component response regulator
MTRARKEEIMKTNRRFGKLSRSEREFLEMVLLEEMDRQMWYAVSFSTILGGELFLALQ